MWVLWGGGTVFWVLTLSGVIEVRCEAVTVGLGWDKGGRRGYRIRFCKEYRIQEVKAMLLSRVLTEVILMVDPLFWCFNGVLAIGFERLQIKFCLGWCG